MFLLFMATALLFQSDARAQDAGEHAREAPSSSMVVGFPKVWIGDGLAAIEIHEKLMTTGWLDGEIAIPSEGSVLPGSYEFPPGTKRETVVKKMQDAMRQTIDELWKQRSVRAVVKSPEEALILASIIQSENPAEGEWGKISAVYSNRLRQGMMLQADATIIYPITKGKPLGRRIRQSEIQAINGYNTYQMEGLPKGPINNPSREAIFAALHPEESPYLYFVSDGNGGHVFANTLGEHNRNVEKWYAIRRARGDFYDTPSGADDAVEDASSNEAEN